MVIGNMKERRKANRKKLCYVLILKIVFSEIICIRLFSLIKRLKVLFTDSIPSFLVQHIELHVSVHMQKK